METDAATALIELDTALAEERRAKALLAAAQEKKKRAAVQAHLAGERATELAERVGAESRQTIYDWKWELQGRG